MDGINDEEWETFYNTKIISLLPSSTAGAWQKSEQILAINLREKKTPTLSTRNVGVVSVVDIC